MFRHEAQQAAALEADHEVPGRRAVEPCELLGDLERRVQVCLIAAEDLWLPELEETHLAHGFVDRFRQVALVFALIAMFGDDWLESADLLEPLFSLALLLHRCHRVRAPSRAFARR